MRKCGDFFCTFSLLLKLWIIGRWQMKRHEDESCAVFLLVQKWKTRCIFGGKNNPEYDCYIAIKFPLSFFQFLIWIMWSRNLVGIWHRRFNWIIKTQNSIICCLSLDSTMFFCVNIVLVEKKNYSKTGGNSLWVRLVSGHNLNSWLSWFSVWKISQWLHCDFATQCPIQISIWKQRTDVCK